MKIRLFVAACALGLMAVSSASGALILNINTTDKTFAFTGSDTGTAHPALYFQQWNTSLSVVPGATGFSLGAVGVTSSPDAMTSNDFWVNSDGSSYAGIAVQFTWATTGASETLTANGVYHSYASLSASQQALFESTIGMSLSAVGGTYHAIDVVPEPTSCALLSLGAAALALRRRVRKA